ncbi:MAG: DUF5720 family protein [Oscillospiraceae bacterium]
MTCWSVERFRDDTRYMVEFEVLGDDNLVALRGETARLFLSEQGYQKVLHSHGAGENPYYPTMPLLWRGISSDPRGRKHH